MKTGMHKYISKIKLYGKLSYHLYQDKAGKQTVLCQLNQRQLFRYLAKTRWQVMRINYILFHWKEHDQEQFLRLE